MTQKKKTFLNSKNTALTVCFASLYAFFCLIPIFQIVGLQNRFITMASMLAPVIGILLGSFQGFSATLIGGIIGVSAGSLSLPSLVSGVAAAFFAGCLHEGKRKLCISLYCLLLLLFGFYPSVGPVWLYPPLMWFQIIGFIILASPTIQRGKPNSAPAFFTLSLISTLAGQIAGSLTFEATSWPILLADLNAWKANWQAVTFIYPAERVIIALGSTILATAAHKALKNTKLTQNFNINQKHS